MNKIRKVCYICLIIVMVLTGCSKRVKPIEVIETEFNIQEAETIMKRAWKPIHDMTSSDYETKPNIKISSREEFFKAYDFSFIDEYYMYDTIYQSIASFEHDEETNQLGEIKDGEGYLVFREGTYIPTIYDEGVFIKRAYLRDSRYNKEYSFSDIVELVVNEGSNDRIYKHASGFNRKNIFRKNQEGEWVLYSIEGHISIGWERE